MAENNQNPTAIVLCAMMVLVPALGVPNEELLQDTLKSILVSFFTLSAALIFFWQLRKSLDPVNFHALFGLTLGLTLFALGSMAWSHVYLGGVEAVRWFMFSLILFLGTNTFTIIRVTNLAWGIHLGAAIASLWTALQFWGDFGFFAQGPAPASTFVNRNFFGEFIVCTFPLSALLLTRVKDKTSVFFLSFSLGFNIVALMMTGTRSALTGLLMLMVLAPIIIFLYRKQAMSTGWRAGHILGVLAVFAGSIFFLGSIETSNTKLVGESGRISALDRAFTRTLSVAKPAEYTVGSFSIRADMWKSTGRMIKAHPFVGVGAGAWEVHAPMFQDSRTSLETDYYAHNEFVQLVAEYGVVGWAFLLCLFFYLAWAAFITWTNKSEQGLQEAPMRALTLASLLMLLWVSNAGFPWHMATTGALFALSLSVMVGSDIRLGTGGVALFRHIRWKSQFSLWALGGVSLCSMLALYIAHQAIECESKIVRAVKLAITINQYGQPNDPMWNGTKAEMLRLLKDGIAINPHYRKLTPIVADSLAHWGDWKNAVWIWESVLQSRPKVFALLANITRAYMQTGDFVQASVFLEKAKNLQPNSPTVGTLEVMLLSRTNNEPAAASLAKELLRNAVFEPDLLRTAYFLGMRNHDFSLAIEALELRIKTWPNQAIDGWLKLGQIYDNTEAKDQEKAIQSYRAALDAANDFEKLSVLGMIPRIYHSKIQQR